MTLVGLITKHGILIVDFANRLQEEGQQPRPKPSIEAAVLRLRPILMTTSAMVLGAVPLALAHGAGAESRQQIGWVIVGGMSVGTLLTLFVVPSIYSLVGRKHIAARPPSGRLSRPIMPRGVSRYSILMLFGSQPSGRGYCGSISSSVSRTMRAIAALRVQLRSAGMTCQGACAVEQRVERGLIGRHVVIPQLAVVEIARIELPLLGRIVDPVLQPLAPALPSRYAA